MTDEHLPVPDAETRPFWDALGEGRFLLRWCRACDQPHYYPRAYCPHCWSDDVEWREASGRGTVYAATTVRQMGLEPFRSRLPYNVSVVELEEGPRLLTNVVGVPPDEVWIGMAVELAVDDSGAVALPLFRPVAG